MKREKSENKSQDQSGHSEKQLDKGVEIRTFKKAKVKKTIFQKKRKR